MHGLQTCLFKYRLLLLHSAFMLSMVKMLLKGEVGGHALNSHGNYIVDHGKSWNCVFEFLLEHPVEYTTTIYRFTSLRNGTHRCSRGWSMVSHGSHRLEKYLNLEGFLEKYLKNKSALKSTGKSVKGLEKSLNFTICRRIQQYFGHLNQYQFVVPLFGAAYAAPNKGTTILY